MLIKLKLAQLSDMLPESGLKSAWNEITRFFTPFCYVGPNEMASLNKKYKQIA